MRDSRPFRPERQAPPVTLAREVNPLLAVIRALRVNPERRALPATSVQEAAPGTSVLPAWATAVGRAQGA